MPEDAPPLAFRIKAISATLRVPLMTVYAWKNSDVRPLPSETIGSSIFVREKQLVFWLGQHHPDMVPVWKRHRHEIAKGRDVITVGYLASVAKQNQEEMRIEWHKCVRAVMEQISDPVNG